jgi:succinoglycan biosynthesis protein ExoM
MLAHCLDAIGAQILPSGVAPHVVVVDNEPEPNNRRVVQDFAARSLFPVHYRHEPRRGIPQARNAALELCRQLQVDWIAFTDDDCWASPVWLKELLEAAARHEADVVYGRREFLLPLPLQFWAARPEQDSPAEGQALAYAATHNVLFKAGFIHRSAGAGLSFDERLTHGEDTDFFYRAATRGARIVYSHKPVVFETVSRERATLNYQTRRAYHYAASRSHFHRRHKGFVNAAQKLAARWAFQAPVALARLATAPLVWPFSQLAFKELVLKGTARLAGAAGATAGLFGLDGNPYRTIDGY